MPDKKKIKKFIKGLFGKETYTMSHSDLGADTEFTIGKRKTKAKSKKGKQIYKGQDKKEVDTLLKHTKKYGGMVDRYKHGGIIQHD